MSLLDRVKEFRDLPFLKPGMRMSVMGYPGYICGGNRALNLQVMLDESRHSVNVHPTWDTVYYDESGAIVADYCKKETIA